MFSQKILSCIAVISLLVSFGIGSIRVCNAAEPHVKTDHQLRVSNSGKTNACRYTVFLPPSYGSSSRRWPLILFLHGAGERGEDLRRVSRHGPPKLVASGEMDLPFIVVAPQCPKGSWWNDRDQIDNLSRLVSELETNYRIDNRRIYLTGLSMGGYGTWSLAASDPSRFAAIAPICGGGNLRDAGIIKDIPIWVFHGARDNVVPVSESKQMVQAIRAAGGEPEFTIYPKAGHDSWTASYENPDLYQWFLKHQLPET